jgi:hypothetical protein
MSVGSLLTSSEFLRTEAKEHRDFLQTYHTLILAGLERRHFGEMGDLLLGFAVEEEVGRRWFGRDGVYGNFAAAEFFREDIGVGFCPEHVKGPLDRTSK